MSRINPGIIPFARIAELLAPPPAAPAKGGNAAPADNTPQVLTGNAKDGLGGDIKPQDFKAGGPAPDPKKAAAEEGLKQFFAGKVDDDTVEKLVHEHPDWLKYMTPDQRVRAVKELFDGATGQAQEDAARDIILATPNGKEMADVCNRIGWDNIEDELDDGPIAAIRGAIAQKSQADDSPVKKMMGEVGITPELFKLDLYHTEIGPSIEDVVKGKLDGMTPGQVDDLARRLLTNREAVLGEIASLRRRGKDANADELVQVLKWVSQRTTGKTTAAMNQFIHEVHYTDLVSDNLKEGDYAELLKVLPDLADPSLSKEQRIALREVLRRLDPEINAMKEAVNRYGDPVQKAALARFMNAFATFMAIDQSDAAQFTKPGFLQDLMRKALGVAGDVKDSIQELKATVGNLANQIGENLTLGHILGTDDDDKAREVVGYVSTLDANGANLLGKLTVETKVKLINAMIDGFCSDDDEQNILKILKATKESNPAEFRQLIDAVGYDTLDDAIDGDESDEFRRLVNA